MIDDIPTKIEFIAHDDTTVFLVPQSLVERNKQADIYQHLVNCLSGSDYKIKIKTEEIETFGNRHSANSFCDDILPLEFNLVWFNPKTSWLFDELVGPKRPTSEPEHWASLVMFRTPDSSVRGFTFDLTVSVFEIREQIGLEKQPADCRHCKKVVDIDAFGSSQCRKCGQKYCAECPT